MKRAISKRAISLFVAVALVLSLGTAFIFKAHAADDASAATKKAKPIRALLVCGGCCHDYTSQKKILSEGIAKRANVEFTIVHEGDGGTTHKHSVYNNADWSKDYDVVIHDECVSDVKDLDFINNILKPHKEGLPAVVLHCGMHCYRSEGWPEKVTPWFEFTGLQTTGHGAQLPIAISFTDKESPITKGLADWTTVNEELYNNIKGKLLDTGKILARGKQGKDDNICVWTNTYGKGKVFCTTIGHNNDTVKDDRYLDLVTRGLLSVTGHLTDDGKPAEGYSAK